jgi:flagellar hook-basal body complex protein FliE
MNVEAVAALANLASVQGADPAASTGMASQQIDPASGFGQMVTDGIQEVNRGLMVSETDLQQLATGETQNLHHVMIRLEESRLSFELMMQVRNRVLEAYQDVMKMQV